MRRHDIANKTNSLEQSCDTHYISHSWEQQSLHSLNYDPSIKSDICNSYEVFLFFVSLFHSSWLRWGGGRTVDQNGASRKIETAPLRSAPSWCYARPRLPSSNVTDCMCFLFGNILRNMWGKRFAKMICMLWQELLTLLTRPPLPKAHKRICCFPP